MRRFRSTRQAKADLFLLRRYSERHSGIDVANRLIERIDAIIADTLVRFPNSGRLRPALGFNVRSYPIPPFVIFYRVGQGRVTILRILHGKRDIHEPLMSLLIAG